MCIRDSNSICETDGATLIIVDVSGQSVYSYGPGKNLVDRWASLVYGKNINGNKGTVIESKKDYTLQYMVDDVTSDTVSYTHLDVYKRQVLETVLMITSKSLSCWFY